MIQLWLKLNRNLRSKRTLASCLTANIPVALIFREASRWFGTDEVAPLLPGGEKDLRFSAVPQGCGLRHGGRSRGRFHDDLRKRGGDNVRRRHILGRTVADGFEAFSSTKTEHL